MVYGCIWYNIGTIDVEMRLSYHLRDHYVGVEFRWAQRSAAKVSKCLVTVREASEAFLDVNHVEVQQKLV